MATTKTTTSKATTDSKGNALYLRVEETREHGYFHLRARVCTQQYEQSSYQPYGCDDDYSDGLLWSGLRCSCQGDERSQQRESGRGESGAVYGFDVEYDTTYGGKLDLRKVRRMHKTLERIDKKLEQLREARGYVTSYGEYLGRVAEVLGCAGMVYERPARSREMSGQRWDWMAVGDGVNRANHRIFLWQQEAVEREAQQLEARQPLQLQAGDEVAS